MQTNLEQMLILLVNGYIRNGSQVCDTFDGPCSCGATHFPQEWEQRFDASVTRINQSYEQALLSDQEI